MSALRQIRDVGVREFRDHATRYLSGLDTLAIRKNGQLIGIYVPINRDEEKLRQAVGRVESAVDELLEQNGVTEDELVELIVRYRPIKRDEEKRREAVEQFGRTMQQIREETGMTEDEFADLFDLNKPFEE
jgi:cell division protein ZapA (FtsZ GTPase activity inhibitor)